VGAWSPSNTMWPWPRPISVPNVIFIHLIVWPQYTNVTDRLTDRTDDGPRAQSEPFYKRSPNERRKCRTPSVLRSVSPRHVSRVQIFDGQTLSTILQRTVVDMYHRDGRTQRFGSTASQSQKSTLAESLRSHPPYLHSGKERKRKERKGRIFI